MPEIDLPRWTGSLATSLDSEDLAAGDFRVLENFVYDDTGFPSVRGGRRIYNTTPLADPIRALYHYRSHWVSNIAEDWLIAYAGGSIYKAEPDGLFSSILDGIESGCQPSFATLRGWLILATGDDKTPRPYYWDGRLSTMAVLSNAPSTRLVASHANRLWAVDRDYPSRVWFSAAFEPANWSLSDGAGYITVGPGDGNHVSAMVPGFAGELIIFKDGPGGGAIYRIQGETQPFAVVPLSVSVGAVSHRAVSQIGDRDIFFASRRGIHSLQRVFQHGDLETQFLDAEVSERWRSLPDHRKAEAVCVDDYQHDTWWLFVDTDNDGVNDTGWLWNYRHSNARGNAKISDVTFGADAATVYRDQRIGRELLITAGSDGYCRTEHHPEAQDETTPGVRTDIEWKARLAPIEAGDPQRLKTWYELWLGHDNWGYGTFDIEWFGDNRPPQSMTIDLNPADMPTPYIETRLMENRFVPPRYRAQNLVPLSEGGAALNVVISGTRGRIRLRQMKIVLELGELDYNAHTLRPYTETQSGT